MFSVNMEQSFFIEEPLVLVEPVKTDDQPKRKSKTVSFSQYAKWLKCPMDWKLSYMDKLSVFDMSINTAFGDGVHVALQEFLTVLYTKGASEADALDCYGLFRKEFDEGVIKLKAGIAEKVAKFSLTEGVTPEKIEEYKKENEVTDEQVAEFQNDGKVILEHVISPAVRLKHFPSKVYELVGVELPLEIPIRGGTITYKGYLDIVLRDRMTKRILILDFKTSTFGWNKYQKADRTKIDQLLLYKRFYNQLYKTPMSDIEVEFFIVKRKLLEDVAFPQQRIQRISPPDGKLSIKEVETTFLEFINECFDENGEHNKGGVVPRNPYKNKKNCKYCIFKKLLDKNGNEYCSGKPE